MKPEDVAKAKIKSAAWELVALFGVAEARRILDDIKMELKN